MEELTNKIKINVYPVLNSLKNDINDILDIISQQEKKKKNIETDVQRLDESIRKKKTECDVARNERMELREQWNQIVKQLQVLGDYTFFLFTISRTLPVDNLKLLSTLARHTGGVRSVVISPDGQRLVSGSFDEMIRVWSLQTGMQERTLDGHTGAV